MMNPIKRVSGLGRGLSALLDDSATGSTAIATPPTTAQRLPVAHLHPNPKQPRRRFEIEAMTELVESVRERGVIQPILVRPRLQGEYEIIAGERRWRAAQAAQRHDVPVTVIEADDALAFEIALIENIQRADLNPIEEADGYRRLVDEFGHTQEGLAKAVGKSRSHIANMLRLTALSDTMRSHVAEGRLSFGHAKVLIGHPDCEALADKVIAGGLSVRQTEALLSDKVGAPKGSGKRRTALRDPDVEALESMLCDATGLSVAVDTDGTDGTVRIDFRGLDQLDHLVARLTGSQRVQQPGPPVLDMTKGAPALRLDVPTFFHPTASPRGN